MGFTQAALLTMLGLCSAWALEQAHSSEAGDQPLCLLGVLSTVPPNPDPDPNEIAKKVLTRIRETPFLRLTVRIQHEQTSLAAVALMGKDRLRTDVTENGHRVISFSVLSGRVQEFVPMAKIDPDQETRNVLLEYDADPSAADEGQVVSPAMLVSNDLGCQFGNLTESWLARKADGTPEHLEAKLRQSEFKGREEVDGRTCLVFRLKFVPTDDLTVDEAIFVDELTMDVRRWETVQTKDGTPIKRVRSYTGIEHSTSDDGWAWRLDLKTLIDAPSGAAHASTGVASPAK